MAAHFADDFMFLVQAIKHLAQLAADFLGICLQAFLIDDLQNGAAGGTGGGACAIGMEREFSGEGVGDMALGTTAAKGKPLPMPLAMTTISGTMPWASKPQKLSPVRPKPDWTSSTIIRPPRSRTLAAAAAR